MKKREIFADTYAESDFSLEVYVNPEECPANNSERELHKDFEGNDQAVCFCRVGARDYHKPCPYFEKIKQVQRNKERKFKVFCKALD